MRRTMLCSAETEEEAHEKQDVLARLLRNFGMTPEKRIGVVRRSGAFWVVLVEDTDETSAE